MNAILKKKLLYLTKSNETEDLSLLDYKDVDKKTYRKDLNLTRVRGSVRLSTSRFLLPIDVDRDKKKISKFSFR